MFQLYSDRLFLLPDLNAIWADTPADHIVFQSAFKNGFAKAGGERLSAGENYGPDKHGPASLQLWPAPQGNHFVDPAACADGLSLPKTFLENFIYRRKLLPGLFHKCCSAS